MDALNGKRGRPSILLANKTIMIKSSNYITEEVRKAAEQEALATLMNSFTEAMFEKIMFKTNLGYKGWDISDPVMIELLQTRLRDNLTRGDWVDVACLSMLLWNMQQPDSQATGSDTPLIS